jgi:hypothetical protein
VTSPDRLVALVEYALKGALGPVVARLAEIDLRLAEIETRPPVAGPAGPQGPPGPPGAPGLKYAGVYVDGQAYGPGDLVTHGGSVWHCERPTAAKPGTTADGWQLMVKRGKDGRDVRREG